MSFGKQPSNAHRLLIITKAYTMMCWFRNEDPKKTKPTTDTIEAANTSINLDGP